MQRLLAPQDSPNITRISPLASSLGVRGNAEIAHVKAGGAHIISELIQWTLLKIIHLRHIRYRS